MANESFWLGRRICARYLSGPGLIRPNLMLRSLDRFREFGVSRLPLLRVMSKYTKRGSAGSPWVYPVFVDSLLTPETTDPEPRTRIRRSLSARIVYVATQRPAPEVPASAGGERESPRESPSPSQGGAAPADSRRSPESSSDTAASVARADLASDTQVPERPIFQRTPGRRSAHLKGPTSAMLFREPGYQAAATPEAQGGLQQSSSASGHAMQNAPEGILPARATRVSEELPAASGDDLDASAAVEGSAASETARSDHGTSTYRDQGDTAIQHVAHVPQSDSPAAVHRLPAGEEVAQSQAEQAAAHPLLAVGDATRSPVGPVAVHRLRTGEDVAQPRTEQAAAPPLPAAGDVTRSPVGPVAVHRLPVGEDIAQSRAELAAAHSVPAGASAERPQPIEPVAHPLPPSGDAAQTMPLKSSGHDPPSAVHRLPASADSARSLAAESAAHDSPPVMHRFPVDEVATRSPIESPPPDPSSTSGDAAGSLAVESGAGSSPAVRRVPAGGDVARSVIEPGAADPLPASGNVERLRPVEFTGHDSPAVVHRLPAGEDLTRSPLEPAAPPAVSSRKDAARSVPVESAGHDSPLAVYPPTPIEHIAHLSPADSPAAVDLQNAVHRLPSRGGAEESRSRGGQHAQAHAAPAAPSQSGSGREAGGELPTAEIYTQADSGIPSSTGGTANQTQSTGAAGEGADSTAVTIVQSPANGERFPEPIFRDGNLPTTQSDQERAALGESAAGGIPNATGEVAASALHRQADPTAVPDRPRPERTLREALQAAEAQSSSKIAERPSDSTGAEQASAADGPPATSRVFRTTVSTEPVSEAAAAIVHATRAPAPTPTAGAGSHTEIGSETAGAPQAAGAIVHATGAPEPTAGSGGRYQTESGPARHGDAAGAYREPARAASSAGGAGLVLRSASAARSTSAGASAGAPVRLSGRAEGSGATGPPVRAILPEPAAASGASDSVLDRGTDGFSEAAVAVSRAASSSGAADPFSAAPPRVYRAAARIADTQLSGAVPVFPLPAGAGGGHESDSRQGAPQTIHAARANAASGGTAAMASRQAEAPGSVPVSEPQIALPAAAAGPQQTPMDVAGVAEQVYRLIVQRVAVEKERSGW